MITKAQLVEVCPAAGKYHAGIVAVQDRFKINTRIRIAHFLAQCAHESAGFTAMAENLNYSEKALCDSRPVRFRLPQPGENPAAAQFADGLANAKVYARNPKRIASRLYAGRMGNGNEASGDGWTTRGRGALQCTGTNNYIAYGRDVYGDPRLFIENPDRLETDPDCILVSGWFWNKNGLNPWADTDEVNAVSGIINTGKATGKAHGMESRRMWLSKFRKVLGC